MSMWDGLTSDWFWAWLLGPGVLIGVALFFLILAAFDD